jgi:hypothetical protein
LNKKAIFPDGPTVELNPAMRDPREVFADWLLRPDNPYFSRTIGNQVWSWLMGRGIVHEPGDSENPSAGLTIHHTDARVSVKAPPNEICFDRVGEA